VLAAAGDDVSTAPVRHQDRAVVALSHVGTWWTHAASAGQRLRVGTGVRLDTHQVPHHHVVQVLLLTPL